jgi:hypothetical protein
MTAKATEVVPYFEGRLAPVKKPHPHRMREISRPTDEAHRNMVLLACADCGRTEVVNLVPIQKARRRAK